MKGLFMKNRVGILAGLLCASMVFSGPYDTWSNYRTVTVNTTTAAVTGTVTNFPLLVRLTNADSAHGSNVLAGALSRGADVRFTDSLGAAALPFQIEQWSVASAAIWVLVPSIAGSATTNIRMYWGKSGQSSASNGGAVFTNANGFVSVWHMGDTTGILPRPNAVTGAPPATPSNDYAGATFGGGSYTAPVGVIGLADSSRSNGSGTKAAPNATSDYFTLGNAADNTTTPYTGNNTFAGYGDFSTGHTMSLWFKPSAAAVASSGNSHTMELASGTSGNWELEFERGSGLNYTRGGTSNGTNGPVTVSSSSVPSFVSETWS
jgi:hypothetical protein